MAGVASGGRVTCHINLGRDAKRRSLYRYKSADRGTGRRHKVLSPFERCCARVYSTLSVASISRHRSPLANCLHRPRGATAMSSGPERYRVPRVRLGAMGVGEQ